MEEKNKHEEKNNHLDKIKEDMETISWICIDKYFEDNPNNLVAHHLDSYNDFFQTGIQNIFRENNPIRFIERKDDGSKGSQNECYLYLGGKEGNRIYYGKPIIYDESHSHYMYPNDARLRNMTYGSTIHYDVEVEMVYYVNNEKQTRNIVLEKIYLGRFPIMLQSDLCILKSLSPEVRFNMGECRNDYGGYFIIDGKEKVILSQEKFADNMLYVRKNKGDDIYSFSAEIRSVSEDPSKPMRTTAVKLVAPSTVYSNNQIVVNVPNVKKPIPLFILMRALGVISDKQIIQTCLLDLEKYIDYVDLFIPSVHDANRIFNQQVALEYIATFTKRETVSSVHEILMNFFLPHVGEDNYLDKAYFLGYMVNKLLKVVMQEEKPTDRDSFLLKRVELSGTLLYDLFREYYLIQKREITQKIDKEHYYHNNYKEANFPNLIEDNYIEFFKERTVETGFKKAFKGNWGSQENTKKLGVVQDLNRLSWFSFISHLRKMILPLDASAKVVGPRHLNSSQWGYVDPVDTPDGGHIGLHKHLAISTIISTGYSLVPLVQWLREYARLRWLQECSPEYMASKTKVFVNGRWVGVVDNPLETVNLMKMFRRNGMIPIYTSIAFDYKREEIKIYSDSGRLMRPIYYVENQKPSFPFDTKKQEKVLSKFKTGKITWQEIVSGGAKKADEKYSYKSNKLYNMGDLYPGVSADVLKEQPAVIDYVDTSEEESALIAMDIEDVYKKKLCTHLEIDPSLIFGVMGNSVIFPEHNQFPRDVFSCGQSRQAVSVYHSNYTMRMDKMGVILNYGQTPLIKSRYLQYINREQQPYGVNAIVAIMSYTGYNVEDAILINQGAIDRGIFRTTYYSMVEAREQSSKIAGTDVNSVITNVMSSSKKVVGLKPGYDYGYLDEYGMVKENTELNDRIVLIGKLTSSANEPDIGKDDSVVSKKGQMGFVDKAFITEGEEGTKISKIRIREDRLPAIGDKMASRAGQKGTLGLILPEEDMPFTSDGVRPDLIINPHALPSRMTIGQLVESILGKICVHAGGFGDCTAFLNKGSNTKIYGQILVNSGYHASGNQMLYNGMTGEPLQADIYLGPTYYMRLKHMVKDKINYRARGPKTMLTRQTVQGRANDGGLRVGEMERDGILAHGASHFLNESFLVRGDEYFVAVCNKTGCLAIYNESKNLFLSPYADGPIQFARTVDDKLNLENISRFGRSFSVLRVPYAFKLLMHELMVMGVQMRIITEENVDQLMSMSFSNNVVTLLKSDRELHKLAEVDMTDENLKYLVQSVNINNKINQKRQKEKKVTNVDERKDEDFELMEPLPTYAPGSPAYAPGSPAYDPGSPAYAPGSPAYAPGSPAYSPGSPAYAPETPPYAPETPPYAPGTPQIASPIILPIIQPVLHQDSKRKAIDFGSFELNEFFDKMSESNQEQILSLNNHEEQVAVLKSVKSKTEETKEEEKNEEKQNESLLELPLEEEEPSLKEPEEKSNDGSNTKKIKLDL